MMNSGDFCPQYASRAFYDSIERVARYFLNENHNLPKQRIESLVRRQIFENRPLQTPLFRLFVMNSTNRSGGPRLAQGWDWDRFSDVFSGFFEGWDVARFARRYPRVGNCPSPALRHEFADLAVAQGVIAGNVNYHVNALRQVAVTNNGWVRMLRAAQEGGCLFARLPDGAGPVVNDAATMLQLWGFDLAAIPVSRLTVDHLWRATDTLVKVPEIGRQLALNFVKDAGYAHAFKPDTHTRKVAGMAFRRNPGAYASNNDGARACVGACLAFTQVLASCGPWNGWHVSLAAVDRLMWLAGSGNLWVAGGAIPSLPKGRAAIDQRRREIADILRTAVLPGRLDA